MGLNNGYIYRTTTKRGGQSVLDLLAQEFQHSSRETWLARLRRGEVELDGVTAQGSELLRPGQLLLWHRPPWQEAAVPLHFEVIYQDTDLLAVNKPAGLPTLPGGGFLQHTLLTLVRERWPTASPLHRLGRGTSGLLLFALTEGARAALSRAWRNHEVTKIYLALAEGIAPLNEYDITTPIGPVPHPKLGEVFAASSAGKPSRSLARVLARYETPGQAAATLCEVQIFTGRPHQIRIHLASLGFPLLGDPLYLRGGQPRLTALPGDLGYLLHAHKLEFKHPTSGHILQLVAPLPRLPY